MWQSSNTTRIGQDAAYSAPRPGGQYAAGWVGLFLFIALGRMVTFCKEGGGMLLVWALRARSYKTRAEV